MGQYQLEITYLEVPSLYNPLQPARQGRGGLHPARRSFGGDGGARGEGGKGGIREDKGVFLLG